MRWLLDNIQIVIAVAGIVAYYLNEHRRRKAQQDRDEEGNPLGETELTRQETSAFDLDEEERTRRIREEMLRKRAEREAGRAQPSAPPPVSASPAPQARRLDAPPPVFQDPLGEFARKLAKQMNPEPEEKPAYLVDEDALARQRQLEEQMRALEQQRRETFRKAEEARQAVALRQAASSARKATDEPWLSQLRSTEGLRRAVIASEVLGKPVGLR